MSAKESGVENIVMTAEVEKQAESFDILLFDLDGTLYSADCGYVEHTRSNIFEYIYQRGWVPRDESAEDYWRPKFQKYHQSLRCWKATGHEIPNEDEYWNFTRQGVEKFLNKDFK